MSGIGPCKRHQQLVQQAAAAEVVSAQTEHTTTVTAQPTLNAAQSAELKSVSSYKSMLRSIYSSRSSTSLYGPPSTSSTETLAPTHSTPTLEAEKASSLNDTLKEQSEIYDTSPINEKSLTTKAAAAAFFVVIVKLFI